jgi:hypothetical protein
VVAICVLSVSTAAVGAVGVPVSAARQRRAAVERGLLRRVLVVERGEVRVDLVRREVAAEAVAEGDCCHG